MARQLVVYNGTVYTSDSQNTAGAIVERDSNGNIYGSELIASETLQSNGALIVENVSYSAAATLSANTTIVKASAASGAFTLTLPPAASSEGLVYVILKTDSTANVVTVKGNGAELINAANTYTGLSAQYNVVRLFCDGTQWYEV